MEIQAQPLHITPAPLPSLGRHRVATAVAFATQGEVFIGLTTRLPTIQDKWHISTGTLSLLMLMMVLLAGVGSVSAETHAARLTSAGVLRLGLLIVAAVASCISLAGVVFAPTWPIAVLGFAPARVRQSSHR